MNLKFITAFTFTVFVYIIFNLNSWKMNRTLHWDKSGYYLYLPATFIYHDIGRLMFLDSMNANYHFVGNESDYGIYNQPTGLRLNKYPVGVSVFQLPFFLTAHCITQLSKEYPADGYSPYYMLWICISSAFWSSLGILILGNFLKRYFNLPVTIITLLLIAFGTNLYFYSSFDTGMSHPYSFFLLACVMNLTDKWYRTGKSLYVILLGLMFGLIFIVRPVNVLCIFIPLLWQTSEEKLTNRLSFFLRGKQAILIAVLLAIAVSFIQLYYWKYITGNWFKYSYEGERFNFTKPHILDGLFSYRKGWFVYTPLAFFASIGFFLFKKYTSLLPAFLTTMLVAIYVIFSWECWYYGGSFGCRALIEFFAVMAFPLAVLIRQIAASGIVVRITGATLLVSILALNLWQTYQFTQGAIPWDGNTEKHYWKVFFKLKSTPEDEKLL